MQYLNPARYMNAGGTKRVQSMDTTIARAPHARSAAPDVHGGTAVLPPHQHTCPILCGLAPGTFSRLQTNETQVFMYYAHVPRKCCHPHQPETELPTKGSKTRVHVVCNSKPYPIWPPCKANAKQHNNNQRASLKCEPPQYKQADNTLTAMLVTALFQAAPAGLSPAELLTSLLPAKLLSIPLTDYAAASCAVPLAPTTANPNPKHVKHPRARTRTCHPLLQTPSDCQHRANLLRCRTTTQIHT
jgi:hypothetical protein